MNKELDGRAKRVLRRVVDEFMHNCSTKWAVFLLSLKSLLETGHGAAEPHDVKFDNWN